MLGLAMGLETGSIECADPLFFTVTKAKEIIAAGLRTPPHNLVLTECGDDKTQRQISNELLRQGQNLSGVIAPGTTAELFAREWSTQANCIHRLVMQQRIYQLESVTFPASQLGTFRVAGVGDSGLVAEWFQAFQFEAVPHEAGEREKYDRAAEKAIKAGMAFLLEDNGRPVSMAAVSGRTPNGIRINYVYTPKNLRGVGYASALVAKLSQRLLDSGFRFCFLYTDLTNPTSNKIYQRIGYTPVCESRHYLFSVPA